jgi:hypothetical protein
MLTIGGAVPPHPYMSLCRAKGKLYFASLNARKDADGVLGVKKF